MKGVHRVATGKQSILIPRLPAEDRKWELDPVRVSILSLEAPGREGYFYHFLARVHRTDQECYLYVNHEGLGILVPTTARAP